MAERRQDLRRFDEKQNKHFRRSLIVSLFFIIVLTFASLTLMNPAYMKNAIKSSSTSSVVEREVNENFDTLAALVGADKEDRVGILTTDQTQAIAEDIIDYTLGVHWFRQDGNQIVQTINQTILSEINAGSSTQARSVEKKLRQQTNPEYAVGTAFSVPILNLQANLNTLFIFVNLSLILICVMVFISTIQEMWNKSAKRVIVHDITGSGIWSGVWIIVIFGFLAVLPNIVNLENLPVKGLGYWLEIASPTFLELVVVGVLFFVITAIPWQASREK